jgi:hypothetical protein
VAGPPGHIAEGFGRFNPADFARFVVIARSSLMESQNHLLDLVDRKYIDEATRQELDALAQAALEEVTGLMEYLQSPEALQNARRARERRIASRPERRKADKRNVEHEHEHEREQEREHEQEREPEPEHEPETEHEPSSENREE